MLSRAIVILLVSVSIEPPPATAAMVPTVTLLQATWAPAASPREGDRLARRLCLLGVTPEEAQTRAAALTPQEQTQTADALMDLPAGGDLIGASVFVGFVVLMTDILGYTDVYPFVTHTVHGAKPAADAPSVSPLPSRACGETMITSAEGGQTAQAAEARTAPRASNLRPAQARPASPN